MRVLLHLVAKPKKGDTLVRELKTLGFDKVRRLPDERVILSAETEDLRTGLGLAFSVEARKRRVGIVETQEPSVSLAEDAKLPEAVARLVDRFYIPTPPDRLGSRL